MYMILGSKRIMRPESVKNEARLMRQKGMSYSEITSKLGVAKSTLHTWLYPIKRPYSEIQFERIQHLNNIRPLANEKQRELKLNRDKEISDRVQNEINKFDINNLSLCKSMLATLYWAEGSKGVGSMSFANTDPALSLLYITLLRKCYKLDEEKFRLRLHLHYYHKIKETKEFWSKLLNIPDYKVGKIYRKKRGNSGKRFRKNFHGICFIVYHDVKLRHEILETGRLLSKRFVPVV